MIISLEINNADPEYSGFSPKIIQLECFYAEYSENLGHLMRVFRKIGKFAIFSIKLTSILTIWVENSEKSEFFSKTGTNFRIFSSAKIVGGSVIAQTVK